MRVARRIEAVGRAGDPGGSMLEENGMPAGDLKDSADPDAPAMAEVDDSFPATAIGTEEWGLTNRRRSELIREKKRPGLTAEERAEFERLERLCFAAIDERFPPPVVDEDGLERLRESR
jgi:hypothetical protein